MTTCGVFAIEVPGNERLFLELTVTFLFTLKYDFSLYMSVSQASLHRWMCQTERWGILMVKIRIAVLKAFQIHISIFHLFSLVNKCYLYEAGGEIAM